MRIKGIAANRLTVELDTTDCITLAQACAVANERDMAGDWNTINTLAAALLAGGYAAYACGADDAPRTPAHMWEWWAPQDGGSVPPRRIPVHPRFADFIGEVAEDEQ